MADSWKTRKEYQRVGTRRKNFICQWCGKHFIAKNAHPHKYCSDECRVSAQKAYNTKWVAEKRKSQKMDKEALDKQREQSSRYYAKKVWEMWLEEAKNIVKIVENTSCKGYEVENSVAKYLSDRFRRKSSREKTLDFSAIRSANTAEQKIAESLGDSEKPIDK